MKKAFLHSKHSEPVSVLLVDDNNHGLAARTEVLRELGYCVATANDGEAALAAMEDRTFDVLVTDYRMPRMDGMELIRRVRANRPEAKIIMLSGFVDPLGLTEENTGADVVIAKCGNELNHLVRSVSRLLNSKIPRKPVGSQSASQRAAPNAMTASV